MTPSPAHGVRISASAVPEQDRVLTSDALAFVAQLHGEFEARRRSLLDRRGERAAEMNAGAPLRLLEATRAVRESAWRVAPTPPDLEDRRVEITGPVDRKMMINALNSGARVFMADIEDACSPTWENVVGGQAWLQDAVRRTLTFTNPDGRSYSLGEKLATLVVRPRGWHLEDAHLTVDGQPVSASLFDFGLYFHHNATESIARGTGPYFYLPKLESHLEARLWNDVFGFAQKALGIPHGTIRATVLIETLPAAFEMEEILYELRDHAAGLNAGRWDYLFSAIKCFRQHPDVVLPDRSQLTMNVPFMRSYAELLVRSCHGRGAHAIGGMAAFIPSRRDAEVNERALARVREDKEREAGQGFDGTWVAHPDLVPVAREIFDRRLGGKPNQKDLLRDDVEPDEARLQDFRVEGGSITVEGVRINVRVAIVYIESWLRGLGAVAIDNLMEDAATAEISRSQLWQWISHGSAAVGHGTIDARLYREVRDEVLESLRSARAGGGDAGGGADTEEDSYADAATLLDELVLGEFQDFLTIPGYRLLVRRGA
jgi:malate synthase